MLCQNKKKRASEDARFFFHELRLVLIYYPVIKTLNLKNTFPQNN
ncbi:hypothetical protein PHPI107946_05110 [Phocicoccus pinnipedialis]|uniref:Uncharacterized protein n=1 Tax=Phocicoccus pinnipedialis TaxID=110845 RepID=A0A6V7R7Q0_9BACL|nr:hypothetical protein [Jeotgalicoccus pinnipedialis]CAD2073326.1 hypothetical protein JEOPIN946_00700 [Jeotgalicoccus pinnipedialis]